MLCRFYHAAPLLCQTRVLVLCFAPFQPGHRTPRPPDNFCCNCRPSRRGGARGGGRSQRDAITPKRQAAGATPRKLPQAAARARRRLQKSGNTPARTAASARPAASEPLALVGPALPLGGARAASSLATVRAGQSAGLRAHIDMLVELVWQKATPLRRLVGDADAGAVIEASVRFASTLHRVPGVDGVPLNAQVAALLCIGAAVHLGDEVRDKAREMFKGLATHFSQQLWPMYCSPSLQATLKHQTNMYGLSQLRSSDAHLIQLTTRALLNCCFPAS